MKLFALIPMILLGFLPFQSVAQKALPTYLTVENMVNPIASM